MRTSLLVLCLLVQCLLVPGLGAVAEDRPPLAPMDVFDLEYASDPRFSPDGTRIAYVRNSFDVMTDRPESRIWIVDTENDTHRPLNPEGRGERTPRWSPDGTRIAFLAGGQIRVRHMDAGGETITITREPTPPMNISWSPDGAWIAFTRRVPAEKRSFGVIPTPPEGATWAPPAQVIDRLTYRVDGAGYIDEGHIHVFVVPAEGNTARRLTQGTFDHGGTPEWSRDGETLYVSANLDEDWEYEAGNTEIHAIDVDDGSMTAVTDRHGPDGSPRISPDGAWIAFVGHDEHYQGYQPDRLTVQRLDGSERRDLAVELDRSIADPTWAPDGAGLYFSFDDDGDSKVGYVAVAAGEVQVVASHVGGTTLGRPYASGSYHLGPSGRVVYPRTSAWSPGEVAVSRRGETDPAVLTHLNSDLLPHRTLGRVEEFWVESSHDGLPVQGWIVFPPGFDPERKYPLVLEIHGGPFANYGSRFSVEMQLYAAAGNVVVYTNPRGSTSYGAEFGNAIHHAYPGYDYDDLMTCVDAVIERGSIDTEHLFVTGGSGGGVLTAWIVGKTERFRAAVVAKPVIHWTSFVLTADFSAFFTKYWFPAMPWEDPEHYFARSPLSLVGNVTTPTMLLTGEEDWRTPMSETEQYYQALKLRKVDTAMVRIPEAGHGIAARPSNLIRKVAHVLGWFDRHSEAH